MKYKIRFLYLFIFCLVNSPLSQPNENPKLVVGIVIDQMRFDYLYRFRNNYGSTGFNRLLNEGTNFTYAHFNYVPTYTGPGHASIYTGTVPYYHGIIGNDWYDKSNAKMINCTQDAAVKGLGYDNYAGHMSPKKLLTTTITDQLKSSTNNLSKVFSVSLKDRASILPGGHSADAAYWYESETGRFITSTYYMNQLPDWVIKFNEKKLPDYYLSKEWDLSKPIEAYYINSPDNAPYEPDLFKEGKTTFPHKFDNISAKSKYNIFRNTPFGNQIIVDFVKDILVNENLGKNIQTDFLAISFSSTDYIGHQYGPNSVEVEDTYIKLDEQLSELLSALDKQVGKDNYLLFLTADHGVDEVPAFLQKIKIPAGYINTYIIYDSLKAFSKRKYNNENLLDNFSNMQFYLNYKLIKKNKLNSSEILSDFSGYLYTTFDEISLVQTREQLINLSPERNTTNLILNGFNIKRSGDLYIELIPNYISGGVNDRTTHGSIYSYDTHIPLIFYGWKIPQREINRPVYIVDIASTIANLLHITEPDGCIGIPILEINKSDY